MHGAWSASWAAGRRCIILKTHSAFFRASSRSYLDGAQHNTTHSSYDTATRQRSKEGGLVGWGGVMSCLSACAWQPRSRQ